MKVVGTRRLAGTWEGFGRLMELAQALRGHDAVCPKGVYRFSSFEEADAWMKEMNLRVHASLGRTTSRESGAR